jgi:hypothetical protein
MPTTIERISTADHKVGGKLKFRLHRGTLAESLATTCDVASKSDLAAAITNDLQIKVSPEMLHIAPYTFDERINWDTHIVTADGYGVAGFTNGPLF